MKARALHSTLTADGHIRLTLAEVDLGAPSPDEVIVRVDATPVNPTDLALMLSGADLSRATASAGTVVAPVPAGVLQVFAGRIGQPLPLGTEGSGTVIAAGASPAAQALAARWSPQPAGCSRPTASCRSPPCASCRPERPRRTARRRSSIR